jgi:hypothetical protein
MLIPCYFHSPKKNSDIPPDVSAFITSAKQKAIQLIPFLIYKALHQAQGPELEEFFSSSLIFKHLSLEIADAIEPYPKPLLNAKQINLLAAVVL